MVGSEGSAGAGINPPYVFKDAGGKALKKSVCVYVNSVLQKTIPEIYIKGRSTVEYILS